jgi:excisionase family DNA binding protein
MNQGTPTAPRQSFAPVTTAVEGLVDVLVDHVVAGVAAYLEALERPEAAEWRLLTVREVGARLGRSERWVRQAVKDRGLPHVRLDGGALAFDPDDVRTWADGRRIPARDQDPLAKRLQGGGNRASGNAPRTQRLAANQRVGV